jgi:hypothetical protein
VKVLFAILAGALILSAHHSTAPFDMQHETTVSGTVFEFVWTNPHSYIYLDVPDASGTHRWRLEAESLNLLRRNGWTKESLKPGDEISCLGARAKDPDVYAMKCFVVKFADGRKLVATPGLSPNQ